MPAFDVTVNPTTIEAKAGEKQSVVVTVTNKLGRPVTARASAVVDPANASAWIKAPPDAQRAFSQAATLDFQFGIEVPAAGPAGLYKVRIDVVDIEQPDDNFGQSPMIAVTVPKPPEVVVTNGGGGVPWWVWLVAALVIVGVGFGIWKAFFSSKGMPNLVNKPYADAIAALDSARFVITRVDTLNQDTTSFKRGVVISQSIAPKEKLKSDSNVLRLVVQKSYAVVPNLAGKTADAAGNQLGLDSLLMSIGHNYVVTPQPLPDEGRVLRTDPGSGALVVRGQTINVILKESSRPCVGKCIVAVSAAASVALINNQKALAKWKPPHR